jgi:hypothetical protein
MQFQMTCCVAFHSFDHVFWRSWASRGATRNDWAALGGELVLSSQPHAYLQPHELPAAFSWCS